MPGAPGPGLARPAAWGGCRRADACRCAVAGAAPGQGAPRRGRIQIRSWAGARGLHISLLLKLINEAQIFRYLPKPIRRGLFDKGLKAAAEQALIWRAQPVTRLAEAPRDEREREKVGSLLGMLGRLRERLSA